MKNNKGITLIVLIITVIIMLILVAVVIDIANDGKLIDSAKEAVDKTNDRVTQTQTRVDELMGILENTTTGDTTVSLTLEHTDTAVNAGGNVANVVDGVPIPVGFVASGADGEKTKADGLVIYEGSTAVTNSNVETARTTRNQFVWVPVLQNQKIKINVRAKENITSITLKDPLYEDMTIPAPTGKTYTQEINPELNGIYTLTVQIGEEEITQTLRVSSLYAQDFWNDYYAEDWYWPTQGYESLEDMLDDREYESVQEMLEDVEWSEDYSDSTIDTYKNSVNKYGGFYIARYEAGSDTSRTSSGATLTTAYSMKNKYPYNYISQTNAISKANMYPSSTSVTSCLINAAAWDRTLNWLVETEAITKETMFGDSKTWGNYKDSTFNFNGKYSIDGGNSFNETSTTKPNENSWLLGTGITEYTRRKNIYDLAGNLEEWTTEARSSDYVVYGGGDFGRNGSNGPSSLRSSGYPGNRHYNLGFRPTLYINL